MKRGRVGRGRAGLAGSGAARMPTCPAQCVGLSFLSAQAGERMRTGVCRQTGRQVGERIRTRGQAHARDPRGGRVPLRTLHIAERELL